VIDFALGTELELVRETARGFARDELQPRAREAEAARTVPEAVRARFAQTGLAGVEWPERLGGAGLGALARAVVLEELAAGDVGAGWALDALGPGLYPLAELGGEAALERFAAPLLERPGARAVLVWNDAGRVRLEGTGASARAEGEVPWVAAERPDLAVLLDARGAAVVTEGLEPLPLRGLGLRAAGAAALRLRRAPVAARWHDPAGAARARARARLYTAACLVGVARASAEASREYALARVAFGRPIAHHQALAFLIADMHTAVDAARLLVHEAAWRLDAGLDAAEACATAWLEAVESADFVTPNGVQILGGHGFMQDYPLEKYMREARALAQASGGADRAREEAGDELAAGEPPVALSVGER